MRKKHDAATTTMPAVPEREPELPFLRSFLAEVDAAYLYRSASLWCASAGVDSHDALRSHAQEFFAEPFCSTLLSFTRSRIERTLLARPTAHGPRAPPPSRAPSAWDDPLNAGGIPEEVSSCSVDLEESRRTRRQSQSVCQIQRFPHPL